MEKIEEWQIIIYSLELLGVAIKIEEVKWREGISCNRFCVLYSYM